MHITKEQFQALEWALTLAEYFVADQEPSNSCHKGDTETLIKAQKAIVEVRKQNEVTV
jgi:hypothetical protein